MLLGRVLRSAAKATTSDTARIRSTRAMQNVDMPQGMTLKSLKHHVALQPLFAIMGGGIIFVIAYVGRLASKGLEVSWVKHENNEPWNKYMHKQFKMLNPKSWKNPEGVDFASCNLDRPDYRNDK